MNHYEPLLTINAIPILISPSQETPGDPRRPQETPGDPRRPQETPRGGGGTIGVTEMGRACTASMDFNRFRWYFNGSGTRSPGID